MKKNNGKVKGIEKFLVFLLLFPLQSYSMNMSVDQLEDEAIASLYQRRSSSSASSSSSSDEESASANYTYQPIPNFFPNNTAGHLLGQQSGIQENVAKQSVEKEKAFAAARVVDFRNRCTICDYTLKKVAGIDKHLMIHDLERMEKLKQQGESIFLCEEGTCAGKTFFTTKNSFLNHIRKIHKNKQIFCNICGQEMSNASNLRRHKINIHTEKEASAAFFQGRSSSSIASGMSLDELEKGAIAFLSQNRSSSSATSSSSSVSSLSVSSPFFPVQKESNGEITSTSSASNYAYLPIPIPAPSMPVNYVEQQKSVQEDVVFVPTFSSVQKHNVQARVVKKKKITEVSGLKSGCKECGQSIRGKGNLAFHMKIHDAPDEVRTVKCPGCYAFFPHRSNMKVHLRAVHPQLAELAIKK